MNNEERVSLCETAKTIISQVAGLGNDEQRNLECLNLHRELTSKYTNDKNLFFPNMTANVATLFLNTGLCQEKAAYFMATYFSMTGRQDVTLVYLGNTKKGLSNRDHVLVQVGAVVGLDALSLVREDTSTVLNFSDVKAVSIEDYFRDNSDAVFADPLLQCVGSYEDGLEPLRRYCEQYEQTEVIGVRTFANVGMDNVKETAKIILMNAKLCATMVGQQISDIHEKMANTRNGETVDIVGYRRPEVMQFLTERYNESKVKSPHDPKDQTIQFFRELPKTEKDRFDSSIRRILQLGVSLGRYVGRFTGGSRDVIGYDMAKTAIKESRKRGITVREINLEATVASEKGDALAYYQQLAEDLSVPVDLLVLRCFEYLTPEAIVLLMTSVLDLMKPASRFYFDSMSGDEVGFANKHTGDVYFHANQPGYIPSFFGARTDFSIDLHTVEASSADKAVIEHFVVTKR